MPPLPTPEGLTFVRIIDRYIDRKVYRSAVTGRFVSKSFAENNKDTTMEMVVKHPHYMWVWR